MNSNNPANPKTYHVLQPANQTTAGQHANYDVINAQSCDPQHLNYNPALGEGAADRKDHLGVNTQQRLRPDLTVDPMSVHSNVAVKAQQAEFGMNQQSAMSQQPYFQGQQVFHEMLPPVRREPTSIVNSLTTNHHSHIDGHQQSVRPDSGMQPYQPDISSYYRHQRPTREVRHPMVHPGQCQVSNTATSAQFVGQQHINDPQIMGPLNNAQQCSGRPGYQHPQPPGRQNNFSLSRQAAPMHIDSFQNYYNGQGAYHQYDSQFGRPVAPFQNHHTYHGGFQPQFHHQQFAHPQQAHNYQGGYPQYPPQNQYHDHPVQSNNMPAGNIL